MNAIAFSLYGSEPRYLVGAVENARMAGEFYPGWQVHVWLEEPFFANDPHTTQSKVRIELMRLGAFLHIDIDDLKNGMFWRFLVHDLPGVERYIVRDADSRFSRREVNAVNEWVSAGTQLHVMRDHPFWHKAVVLGGMWGWRKGANDFNMREVIGDRWAVPTRFGQDQDFLSAEIYPRALSKTVHDCLFNWPPSSPGFVGEYINAQGRPNEQHRQMRLDCFKKA